jgi:aerobic C4-dicarboxylate transport protein
VKRFSRSLYLQVITAVVIGAVVGHVYPKFGVELKPLGEGFTKRRS